MYCALRILSRGMRERFCPSNWMSSLVVSMFPISPVVMGKGTKVVCLLVPKDHISSEIFEFTCVRSPRPGSGHCYTLVVSVHFLGPFCRLL